jgi:hypothetical protein
MSSTLTVGLPEDAILSQVYDNNGNPSHVNLTVPKTDIPFLVRFLLGGITEAEKTQIPLDQKEKIANAAGLKYVYRLPSIVRTLMIGVACGITIKALADNKEQRNSIARAVIKAGENIGFPIAIPAIFSRAANAIQASPYIASSAMAASAWITSQVPNEVASLVSYTLEGGLSFAKASANVLVSGYKKGTSLVKDYANFWRKNPKTGTVITASLSLGVAMWIKPSEVQNLYDKALKISMSSFSYFRT